jgi:hypothetical protein
MGWAVERAVERAVRTAEAGIEEGVEELQVVGHIAARVRLVDDERGDVPVASASTHAKPDARALLHAHMT